MAFKVNIQDLISGAKTQQQTIASQFNSNPTLQAAGLQYVPDPTTPGKFIQVNLPAQAKTQAEAVTATNAAAGSATKDRITELNSLEKTYGGLSYNPKDPSVMQFIQQGGDTPPMPTIDKTRQTALNKSLAALPQAKAVIKEISDASSRVNTEPGLAGTNFSYKQAFRASKSAFKDRADFSLLSSDAVGLLTPIATSVLGVNRFNQKEQQNLQKAFVPSPYDTKEVAQAKIARVQQIVDAIDSGDIVTAQSQLNRAGVYGSGATPDAAANSGTAIQDAVDSYLNTLQ